MAAKAIKRLEQLQRDTRDMRPASRPAGAPMRYVVALSAGGVSSTALLAVMWENQRQQRARGKRVKFEVVAAVVDTDLGSEDDDKEYDEAEGQGEEEEAGKEGVEAEEAARRRSGKQQQNSLSALLARYRERFPGITFRRLRIEDALGLDTIDWSTVLPAAELDAFRASLPPITTSPDSTPQTQREQVRETRSRRREVLTRLFTHVLPQTPSSREDVVRLLVRHLLIDAAATKDKSGRKKESTGDEAGEEEEEEPFDALLTGHSTTSLAALALAETARGRGFAVPWAVNDGVFALPRQGRGAAGGDEAEAAGSDPVLRIAIYHPLRELFRKELISYNGVSEPPLDALLVAAPQAAPGAAVVSHRALGISDVLTRYFAEVEASYPSVVANVVRTAGKLMTAPDGQSAGGASGAGRCGLCGHALDQAGDERWRGELGEVRREVESESGGRLCYGCERSVYG